MVRQSDLFLGIGGLVALVLAIVAYRRGCFASGAAFQKCLHLPGTAGGAPGGGTAPSPSPAAKSFGIEPYAERPGHVTTGTATPSGPCTCVGGIMQGDTCQTKGEFCSPASFAGISGSGVKKYWWVIAIAVVALGYLWYKKKI